MDLATHQRKLLALIRGTYRGIADEDPYIRLVAQSENLNLIREIALFWRMIHIERHCPLTSRLLKKRGSFEPALSAFVARRGVLPFIEDVASAFLEEMSRHPDSLVASVARLEAALIEVQRGSLAEYVVDWTHDPYAVLEHLWNDTPFDEPACRGHYRTVVTRGCPSLFRLA